MKKKNKKKIKQPDWPVLESLIIIVILATLFVTRGKKQEEKPKQPIESETIQSVAESANAMPPLLSGNWDGEEIAEKYPLAVVIDNIVEARPQEGIGDAWVVYETLAEGDITRFLAIFSVGDIAERVGPVRSIRPYFIQLASEYRAILAHSGGSPQALSLLRARTFPVINFDEFAFGSYFVRDSYRSAPHNLFLPLENAKEFLQSRDLLAVKDLSPWVWSEIAPDQVQTSQISKIVIPFSRKSAYTATWQFDEKRGVWQREGSLIEAVNLVVQFTNMQVLDNEGRRDIEVIGEGKGYLFRDGFSFPVRWEKPSAGTRTRYYDEAGTEIAFAPGKVWISIVGVGTPVSFE